MALGLGIKGFLQFGREATWGTAGTVNHRLAYEEFVLETKPMQEFSKNMPAGGVSGAPTETPWMEDSANAGMVIVGDYAEATLTCPLDYRGLLQFIDMMMGTATFGTYGASVGTIDVHSMYTHTWAKELEKLNSITIESYETVNLNTVSQGLGMKVLGLTLSGKAGSGCSMQVNMGGMTKKFNQTKTGSVSAISRVPILMQHLAVSDDGFLASPTIRDFTLAYKPTIAFPRWNSGSANPYEPVREGLIETTLKYTIEYQSDTIIAAYKAGTQGSPHFTFTSGYRVLDFLLNKAVIIAAPQPKPSLNGIMLQEVTWRAQWLAGTGGMTVNATCDETVLQA